MAMIERNENFKLDIITLIYVRKLNMRSHDLIVSSVCIPLHDAKKKFEYLLVFSDRSFKPAQDKALSTS